VLTFDDRAPSFPVKHGQLGMIR